MVDVSVGKLSVSGSDERSRALRELLYATVMTPLLLFPEPSRELASMEASVAAVGLGVVVGAAVSLTLSDAQLGPQDDLLGTVVGVTIIGAVTVLLWILLPREHIATFLHFSIAFLWGAAIASTARHVVRPALGASDSIE
ncbi:hypothetical protein C488_13791 [Natrinema pellirubrum DSM 15624]|uniref:Uncharacterized protein n=1 Tax=Natrinema pellirubrum (strain DSM 15624 / CIP 106293 / JCM 10476 / NCIMB 786 / 157) TaxID=797303 RepID=L0JJ26_NATP1|nr:hypothetical protein [Natrinema pellirubrum]AGB31545.1 hypothetical protein Natpe_1648 [Natrinema pellirubrum DSM 15624]ELY73335.1 hypothetical protein C488_13791 [Natrinema pellirubrum DSM 15624]